MSTLSVISLNFYAESLRFRTEVRVVLPEYPLQRDPSVPRRKAFDPSHKFPAVYLLHGFTGDYSDWLTMLPIELYASQFGFAVVMPHGYNTWYLDVPGGPAMETMIADELPAAMEAMLPISADPQERFIAGLSMGGTGALRIAWKYPERYRAVAAMSALPDLTLPLGEPQGREQYEEVLKESIVHCHGGRGELGSDSKNILEIARRQKKAGIKLPPTLFQYGEEDPRFGIQYPAFRQFAAQNQLPVAFSQRAGGHDFAFWNNAIQEALAWFNGFR